MPNDFAKLTQSITAIDQLHAALKAATAPLERSIAAKRQEAMTALGSIIVSVIEQHGYLHEATEKYPGYRWMSCDTRGPHQLGFVDIIQAEYGKIDWHTLYAPTLQYLRDTGKIHFTCGMGECDVTLIERLSSDDVARIKAERAKAATP